MAARKSGLVFPNVISFRNWELIGQRLITVVDSSTWWIADWLAYGENTFPGRYQEAAERTSLNYQTLRNYVWVARRFELSRRRDRLSFGHHAEVAALDPPVQDYWLRKAEELAWSRNELRNQLRSSLREQRGADRPADPAGEGTRPDAAQRTGATADPVPGAAPRPPDVDDDPKIIRLHLDELQFTEFNKIARSQNLTVEDWALTVLRNVASGQSADVGGTEI